MQLYEQLKSLRMRLNQKYFFLVQRLRRHQPQTISMRIGVTLAPDD